MVTACLSPPQPYGIEDSLLEILLDVYLVSGDTAWDSLSSCSSPGGKGEEQLAVHHQWRPH